MSSASIWFCLAAATLATIIPRAFGVVLAKSKHIARINEETLSRLFPLAILFCLVFKEMSVDWLSLNTTFIKVIAIVVVLVLHVWKRQLFISVIGGTLFYLFLLRSI